MGIKSYHHGNLRTALIEAGIEFINQNGLDRLSIRKVAALCNVSHAAPYCHFKDKNDLLLAIQNHISDQFTVIFDKVKRQYKENDPEVVNQLGIAYISFFIDNPQYLNFIMQGNLKINVSLDHSKKDSFPAFQIFKDTATGILKNFGMKETDIQNFVIVNWALVHGIASIATMQGVEYDKDWKTQLDTLLRWNKNFYGGTLQS